MTILIFLRLRDVRHLALLVISFSLHELSQREQIKQEDKRAKQGKVQIVGPLTFENK